MFGVLMFSSKLLMEALPNIHLLGMFTVLLTVVYRSRALYPIYTYVLLNGAYAGFSPWWLPYLYIWTVLWGVVMLLPKNMPRKAAAVVYPLAHPPAIRSPAKVERQVPHRRLMGK